MGDTVISKAPKNSCIISASELTSTISVVAYDTNCAAYDKSIKFSYGSGCSENKLEMMKPVDENPRGRKVEVLQNRVHVRFCNDLLTVQMMSLPMYLNHICKCPTDQLRQCAHESEPKAKRRKHNGNS